MEMLQVIAFIGLSVEPRVIFAMNCYEEMNYHEKYSYGYDICCSNLNDSNLHELKSTIVYNEIRLTITKSNLTRINSTLFQNIAKTREILINQSNLDLFSIPEEGAFGNLHQLERLDVSGNNINRISKNALKHLENLRFLNISNNKLSKLDSETFKDAEDLEQLDLSGNRFENLNKIPLCEVQDLRRLYLSHNHIKLLHNSSILCLKLLKYLILDFNNISDLISLSQLRYLVKVNLSHNKIKDLSDAFVKLEYLEELNLDGNNLNVIKSGCFKQTALKKLNLRNNMLRSIEADAFTHLNLQELNLDGNNLLKVPVSNLETLKVLSLSNNHLWEKQEFQNLSSLEYLNLSNCSIQKLNQRFRSLKMLKSLDLSHNKVIFSPPAFTGLKLLHELNLKENLLTSLPDYAFSVLTSLRILDLSHNQLKRLSYPTFYDLKKLEVLNLSYNHLEGLSENVVVHLQSLRKLDLEGNRLKYIDYDIIISMLPNLKLIKIRENSLSCDFLTKMLHYFSEKHINYTISEKLTYGEENVAGIRCKEYDALNSSFEHADALLLEDGKLLSEIYHIAKDDNKNLNASFSTTLLILGLVLLILLISIFGISYGIFSIVKRRNCVNDEIELLDRRTHKWNYT